MTRPDDGARDVARPLRVDAAPESWARGALEWRQTHWGRSEWELRADGRLIGTLTARGTFRERTLGRGPSGDWEIRARWTGAAEIAPDGGAAVASYQPGWWRGGVFTTASGLRYDWTRVGFWRPEYVIANESGFPCVRFRPRSLGPRGRCAVTIEPAGMRIAELEALVLLGWRLLTAARAHAH
jgi:hypothetical protein